MGNTAFKDQWFVECNVKALKKWLKKNDANWRVCVLLPAPVHVMRLAVLGGMRDLRCSHHLRAQNEFGNTVAHWACWRKQLPMLKLAQGCGAELNIQNNGVGNAGPARGSAKVCLHCAAEHASDFGNLSQRERLRGIPPLVRS